MACGESTETRFRTVRHECLHGPGLGCASPGFRAAPGWAPNRVGAAKPVLGWGHDRVEVMQAMYDRPAAVVARAPSAVPINAVEFGPEISCVVPGAYRITYRVSAPVEEPSSWKLKLPSLQPASKPLMPLTEGSTKR